MNTDPGPAAFVDSDHPAEPYPGSRPGHSFVHQDAQGFALTFASSGSWQIGGRDLDAWLRESGAEPLAARVPVLAYGSNACPSKITWLRGAHGLGGPVVVLRTEVCGIAAVWASGRRIVDDQRPATLSIAPGARETHAVWLATAEQLIALDRCEGRGERYDLAELHCGETRLEDGRELAGVLAYVGRSEARMPLLVDGAPVRCAEVAQARAQLLQGVAARNDGLRRTVV